VPRGRGAEHTTRADLVVNLGNIGDVLRASGDEAEARATWQRALDVAENLPNIEVDHVRAKLRGS